MSDEKAIPVEWRRQDDGGMVMSLRQPPPPEPEIGDWWFHPVTGETKELTEDGWVVHPMPVKEEE